MKFTIGTVSNFQEYEKDLQLIKSSLLYADEIELIGLTEYAVFKYLPVVMDGGKDLASLISGLLPFLRSIEITNKDDMLQQLEYAQSQLQIYSPILKKKKRRTTVELQAQLKIKQVQKEIKDKLEEAMAQLITQPSSLELQGLVEKGMIRYNKLRKKG